MREVYKALAVGMMIALPAATILDPKEAVNNPHTHQETPIPPTVEMLGQIVSTYTGTIGWITTLGPQWSESLELHGPRFRFADFE
jgi:hypothetical protein